MTTSYTPSLDWDSFLTRAGIVAGDEMEAEARELFDTVARIGRPKAAFRFRPILRLAGLFIQKGLTRAPNLSFPTLPTK